MAETPQEVWKRIVDACRSEGLTPEEWMALNERIYMRLLNTEPRGNVVVDTRTVSATES